MTCFKCGSNAVIRKIISHQGDIEAGGGNAYYHEPFYQCFICAKVYFVPLREPKRRFIDGAPGSYPLSDPR